VVTQDLPALSASRLAQEGIGVAVTGLGECLCLRARESLTPAPTMLTATGLVAPPGQPRINGTMPSVGAVNMLTGVNLSVQMPSPEMIAGVNCLQRNGSVNASQALPVGDNECSQDTAVTAANVAGCPTCHR
jgi:hypothetical protein